MPGQMEMSPKCQGRRGLQSGQWLRNKRVGGGGLEHKRGSGLGNKVEAGGFVV